MDDADLAGPLFFGFCFGMFLLFVGSNPYSGLACIKLTQDDSDAEWQTPIRLHLWGWPLGCP